MVECFESLGSGALVVDGTCGLGGHAAALLARYPTMRVLGLDRDPEAVQHAARALRSFGERAVVRHGQFGDWAGQLDGLGVDRASGLLLDLGVSSPQLDRPERGFSFREAGPIDMRMDPTSGETALEFLERAPTDEIARVIWRYGEERHSRRISRQIKRALEEDRLSTTADLAVICRRAYPKGRHRIDPATRTFQALRIQVNDELGELEHALAAAQDSLGEIAVVAVISFHSLEDRIVKHTFRDWQKQDLGRILKPAPITADESQREANPRARSAKLRAFLKGARSGGPEGPDRYRSKRHRRRE